MSKAPYISFEGRVTQVKRLLQEHRYVTARLFASAHNLTINRADTLLRRMWRRDILDRFEYQEMFSWGKSETTRTSWRYCLSSKQIKTLGMVQGIGLGMVSRIAEG